MSVWLQHGRLARKRSGSFAFDPNILERDDIAPARMVYLIGSLKALQENYAKAGSQLLILQSDPRQGIPKLAQGLSAKAVFWNWDVEPYSQERDRAVQQALQSANVEVQTFWDQLLHTPEEIRTGSGVPYTVYSPFWKNWSSKPKAKPALDLADCTDLTPAEQTAAQTAGAIDLPTAKDLGYIWRNSLLLEPGELPARECLEAFADRFMGDYQEQRNFPANETELPT